MSGERKEHIVETWLAESEGCRCDAFHLENPQRFGDDARAVANRQDYEPNHVDCIAAGRSSTTLTNWWIELQNALDFLKHNVQVVRT